MHLTWQQSIGLVETHLSPFIDTSGNRVLVCTEMLDPLSQLLTKAEQDNVAISIVSGFRSFERQLLIWNDKWLGYKPVYSRQGRSLNIVKMSNIEKYKAISLWSALPGLSRHHWGCDFDIFAAEAISNGHRVELISEEFGVNGPCYKLQSWLDENLSNFGFFRPYKIYQQGVSSEPWHISHIQKTHNIMQEFDKSACRKYLKNSSIKSAEFINEQFEHYYKQFFCNIYQLNIEE